MRFVGFVLLFLGVLSSVMAVMDAISAYGILTRTNAPGEIRLSHWLRYFINNDWAFVALVLLCVGWVVSPTAHWLNASPPLRNNLLLGARTRLRACLGAALIGLTVITLAFSASIIFETLQRYDGRSYGALMTLNFVLDRTVVAITLVALLGAASLKAIKG